METSGLDIQADGETDAVSKVSMLLECLHERNRDLSDLAEVKRVKLEQRIQLLEFENEANRVTETFPFGQPLLTT